MTPKSASLMGTVIVGAMFFGLATFVIVAAILVAGGQPQPNNMLTIIMLGLLPPALAARFTVPGILLRPAQTLAAEALRRGRESSAVEDLCQGWLKQTIVAAALLEGPGMANAFGYLSTGSPFNLAGAGVPAVLLLTLVPFGGRVQTWVDDQLRLVRDEQV